MTASRSRSICGPRPASPTERRSPPTTWCSPSTRSSPRATRSTTRPCKTWSRPRRSTRKPCATPSPASWCATCRSPSPPCRSSPRPITRASRSRRPRSTRRSARGPIWSTIWRKGAPSSIAAIPDYWAKDLPVNRGRWNFDKIRFEYFRDRTAGMEAFKAGFYDFREEFTSKVWATEYDFPAIRAGKVKKEILPDETPSGTQGFFINTRREQLKDPRVREALDLAFDFEWTNRNLFYGLYDRTAELLRELADEGGGRAVGGRADADRRSRRDGAGRGARARLSSAEERRLGPGPQSAGEGRGSCSTRPAGPSRTACASTTRASRSRSRS